MAPAAALTVILTVALLAAPIVAEARQPGKVYRVGILGEAASDPSEVRLWQILGGHLKTGQSWTGQNRPVG